MIFTTLLATMALAPAYGIDSGLNVGDMLPAYDPKHVTGADKNTKTCPVCKYGPLPAVQVWLSNDKSDAAVAIAKTLEAEMISANKDSLKLKAFMVFTQGGSDPANNCCATPDILEATLSKLAETNGIKNVALAWLPSDAEAFKAYKINRDPAVENTVFVYKGRKVIAKFVNMKGKKKDLANLQAAVQKILQ